MTSCSFYWWRRLLRNILTWRSVRWRSGRWWSRWSRTFL